MHNHKLSRRRFLQLAGMSAAAMALPIPELFADPGRKPNFIVILSDDHGYSEIGLQGCREVATPNIDSIAKNGIRFTNGYVSCPICSPSRAGLLTGRYQTRFGHEDNPGPAPKSPANFGLPEGEKTIGDYMKSLGYVTGIIGKWHGGDRPACRPLKRGFDEFFGFMAGAHSYIDSLKGTANPLYRGDEQIDEKEYLTDALGREAISFIERHKDKPFFLHLAFNAVHDPLQAPDRYKDTFAQFKNPDRQKYAAMLKAMDDNVGRVLAKVREAGIEENTLIFFLGDNGGYRVAGMTPNAPLNGFKGDTYEGGIRIPFMAQWKGHLPAGKVYNKPLISLDILPTVVHLAGGKVASNIEGVDLMPYITGKKAGAPHDKLFWRWIDKYGARVGDWKLVQNGDGKEMLFNLADDIGETKDLATSNPAKLKELRYAYKAWDAKNVPAKWLDWRRGKNKGAGE